jgi:hypothetical protein
MSTTRLDCKYAEWRRTVTGRLHPSGDGRCVKQVAVPLLPASMPVHLRPRELTRPSGYYISRNDPPCECPLKEAK